MRVENFLGEIKNKVYKNCERKHSNNRFNIYLKRINWILTVIQSGRLTFRDLSIYFAALATMKLRKEKKDGKNDPYFHHKLSSSPKVIDENQNK